MSPQIQGQLFPLTFAVFLDAQLQHIWGENTSGSRCTYTCCGCDPTLVMTPSLSISICLNVLTFWRISSSVYLKVDIKTQG